MDSGSRIPPMLDGGVPLLGHMLEFKNQPVSLVQRGRDKLGDVFSIKLPRTHTVVLSGLKAQEAFFRMPDDQGSMKEVYQMTVPIFGKGIAYDATPEVMKEQLQFVFPALREARLKTYASAIVEEAENYFAQWGEEGVVDLYDVGNELTIYTSSRCLLGKSFRKHLSAEFARLYQHMEGGLTPVAFFFPYLPTPAFRRRDRARARMVELIGKVIEERRTGGVAEEDFLQTLMEAHYSDGRALTVDEITGLLLTIIFAGHPTSGVTFSWNQVLLNQHPEYHARVRRELERVVGGRTEIRVEDVRAMELGEWSIKETLRMYPPIIMVMRRILKDLAVGDFVAPAGSMAMVSPAVSHRIPEIFKNPNQYDPDRYGPGREEDKQHPLAHIAFGGGRHRCLGAVFATMQLVAASSVLLRDFDLELLEPEYVPDYRRLLVGPRQPARARYRRRPRILVQVPRDAEIRASVAV